MNYYFDLSRLTVMDYKEYLKSIDLLPSRRVLLDTLDERNIPVDALSCIC